MKNVYEIRKSRTEDLDAMLAIYAGARRRMREGGNPNQWLLNPPLWRLEKDIEEGVGYVVTLEGVIVGAFAFILGEDPTYKVIEGRWLNGEPYGTIHRIAGDGVHGGIVAAAVEFGSQTVDNIRIDTHPQNGPMQHLLPRLGFVPCGKIYIHDDFGEHSPRDAFQLIVRK